MHSERITQPQNCHGKNILQNSCNSYSLLEFQLETYCYLNTNFYNQPLEHTICIHFQAEETMEMTMGKLFEY